MIILQTGGGKSLIYQYASLFIDGLCLVITPLISLMSDQVRNLCPSIPGACLNSSQAPKQKRDIYNKLSEGKLKILFISPEKLVMEDMKKFGKVGLICIDEIHCASEWSHNF